GMASRRTLHLRSQHMYGNCYTFNAFDNGHDPLTTNYPGPLMVRGLTWEYACTRTIESAKAYVPALAQDAGVKIVIHERGTYPIPEDAGLSLPPGMKTSIGLDKMPSSEHYKRLPPPHADCGTSGQGGVGTCMHVTSEPPTQRDLPQVMYPGRLTGPVRMRNLHLLRATWRESLLNVRKRL
ncbi:hypothetical protein DPMN_071182, partial [Dreissena polymorpha]